MDTTVDLLDGDVFWRFLSSFDPVARLWDVTLHENRFDIVATYKILDRPLVLPCDDWWRDFELVYISWNNKTFDCRLLPHNKWEKNTTQYNHTHWPHGWLDSNSNKPIKWRNSGRLLFVDLTAVDGCRAPALNEQSLTFGFVHSMISSSALVRAHPRPAGWTLRDLSHQKLNNR